MRAFSLMYHDVVEPGGDQTSGISGADADLYKLDRADFRRHLDAIATLGRDRVRTCREPWSDASVFLTFDDGGASAPWIAGELERYGWRGHFFITTDWIGKPAFVTSADVRSIAAAGHVIGSHSASHPRRLSALPLDEITRQWRASVDALADILGTPVTVASVPGGFYSKTVGEAAAAMGIRTLFTSEPTETCAKVSDCALLGRFYVQKRTPPEIAASFAGGSPGPRLRQQITWKLKKAAKSLGGDLYVKARVAWLAQAARRRSGSGSL